MTSGDTVEIFTSKVEGAGPSLDWLDFVATRSAQQKIKQRVSRERREDACRVGPESSAKALRSESSHVQKLATDELLAEIAGEFHTPSLDALYTAIGEHRIEASDVVAKVVSQMRGADNGRSEVISSGSAPTVAPAPARLGSPSRANVNERRDCLVLHAGAR